MMVNLMIMGGISIPITAAEEEPARWYYKLERIKHID
jgi:hypothetical protein